MSEYGPVQSSSLMSTAPDITFAGGETSGIGNAGVGLSIAGALTSAIGGYYSVKSAQYQARAQASALEHQQQMSYLNARIAERGAQQSLRAGQYAKGQVGLRYGQLKAAAKARQAAAGIQGGVGSAAEVLTSVELAKEVDQFTITRNSILEANARMADSVNARSRGRLAGMNAANLRGSAGSMSPIAAGAISLLAGGGQVARNWYQYNRTT